MPWNTIQAEINDADPVVRPVVGEGGLTYEGARGEVQSILDRLYASAGDAFGEVGQLAQHWRDAGRQGGDAEDTVIMHAGPSVMLVGIYEYGDDEDARVAGREWLYAATSGDSSTVVARRSLRADGDD